VEETSLVGGEGALDVIGSVVGGGTSMDGQHGYEYGTMVGESRNEDKHKHLLANVG
jgi:ABC-type xylose transport system permease subunit